MEKNPRNKNELVSWFAAALCLFFNRKFSTPKCQPCLQSTNFLVALQLLLAFPSQFCHRAFIHTTLLHNTQFAQTIELFRLAGSSESHIQSMQSQFTIRCQRPNKIISDFCCTAIMLLHEQTIFFIGRKKKSCFDSQRKCGLPDAQSINNTFGQQHLTKASCTEYTRIMNEFEIYLWIKKIILRIVTRCNCH